jgi:hypothetical protein
LREILVCDEYKSKPVHEIKRFKYVHQWNENKVLDALINEILRLPNADLDKIALLAKFLLDLRQRKRKPFYEQ